MSNLNKIKLWYLVLVFSRRVLYNNVLSSANYSIINI